MSSTARPNDLSTAWPYLVSAYVNLCLYTLEVCLAVIYLFTRSERPHMKYIITTSLAVVVDLAGTLVTCARTYLVLIIFPTQGGFPMRQIWYTPATIILNDIAAAIEQSFLLYRFYTLTENLWVTSGLGILVVVHSVFAFISGIWISVDISFGGNFGFTATIIANAVRAAADVGIAAALVIKLHMMQGVYKATRNLIKRVIVHSIASGVTVAACTLVMLILLVLRIGVYSIFSASMGRIYTLTMLTNLLTRERNREIASRSQSSFERHDFPLSSIRFVHGNTNKTESDNGGTTNRKLTNLSTDDANLPKPQRIELVADDSQQSV